MTPPPVAGVARMTPPPVAAVARMPPPPVAAVAGTTPPPVAAVAGTTPPSGQLQQLPVGVGSASDGGSRQPDEDEGSESGKVVAEAAGAAEDALAPAAAGVNGLPRVECKACMQLGIRKKSGQPTTILASPTYVRGHCGGVRWTNNDGKKDPAGHHKAWLAEMEEVWKKEGKADRKRKKAE